LRKDLIKIVLLIFVALNVFEPQQKLDLLAKSDITFVLFEIGC